ncbi:MAG TPA: HAD family hydrolase [Candidatus Microsaccharimonas sp.]|jgi:HAD superfamily hydrolase (TIGR01509 family)
MYTIPTQVTSLSFDIWKTLLGGNKAFTRMRLRLIFEELDLPDVDIEHVVEAYKRADKFFNNEAEHTMTDYGMGERLQMMFATLGIDRPIPDVSTIAAIQAKIGVLRCQPEYLPPLLESDLLQTLGKLKDQGLVLGLLSNTGMDDIQVMEPVLKKLGIWDLFQVRIFSSEDGRAKPNPSLFLRMARELKAAPHQVLHIGDNTNADYRAIKAGLHAVVYAPEGSSYPHITSMSQLLKKELTR